jgi:methyl-accepting chemotaxis protein
MHKKWMIRMLKWLWWWYPIITIIFLTIIHLILFYILSQEIFELYIPFSSQIIGSLLIVISINHDFTGFRLKERINNWWKSKPKKQNSYTLSADSGKSFIKGCDAIFNITPDSLEAIRKDLRNHIKRVETQFEKLEKDMKEINKRSDEQHNEIEETFKIKEEEESEDIKYHTKLQIIGLILAIYGTYIGTFGNTFILDLFK